MTTSNTSDGSNTDILDPTVIQGLKDLGGSDDPRLFLEIVDLFLQDAPLRMEELERGLRQHDLPLVEMAAHTLKSSCANIGALSLSTLCKRIEEKARSNDPAGLAELCKTSLQMWPRVVAALNAVKS